MPHDVRLRDYNVRSRALSVVALLGVLLLGGCAASSEHATGCGDVRFDAADWRAAYDNYSTDTPTRAQRIADGIVKCRLLVGRDRRTVLRMLGRPDNYVAHERGRLSWNLGSQPAQLLRGRRRAAAGELRRAGARRPRGDHHGLT